MTTDWTNEKYCLEAVKENGLALEFVKDQTPEICLEAVKNYGFAIKYVKEQTSEICVQAILNDKDAKRYIKPEILESEEFIRELLMETI